MFEFADGVGCHAFGVFFLDFYLLYGDELGGVGAYVAEVDIGVGSFAEFFTWRRVRWCKGGMRR